MRFCFMDESGRKESDPFFVCGFLEIEDNQDFSSKLQRVYDQIKNLAIRNRTTRVEKLKSENNIEELYNLARNYNEFELKSYRITSENRGLYSDLIKIIFRKLKFKFTAIVANRQDKLYQRDVDGQFPLYLKAFKLFVDHCQSNQNYIFIPDNFESSFKWNIKSKNYPLSIVPLDSKASIQLQIADLLSGLVAQALKINSGLKTNNKDLVREPVLKTLESELGRKINGNFTIKAPNYFSVWIIDWSKSKRLGHGQETQP